MRIIRRDRKSPKLSEYFEVHDWKNYKIIVHALKSTSMVIGAVALSEKAKELESAAKENNEEVLLAEGENSYKEYETVLCELLRVLEEKKVQVGER